MNFLDLGKDIWCLVAQELYSCFSHNGSDMHDLLSYVRVSKAIYDSCGPYLTSIKVRNLRAYSFYLKKIETHHEEISLAGDYRLRSELYVQICITIYRNRLAFYACASEDPSVAYEIHPLILMWELRSHYDPDFKRRTKRLRKFAIKIRALTGERYAASVCLLPIQC